MEWLGVRVMIRRTREELDLTVLTLADPLQQEVPGSSFSSQGADLDHLRGESV